MSTTKIIQTNFTAGVIDPLAAAREDVVFFYNGLEDGYNVLSFPQGGVRRRPGKQHVAELCNKISEISLSGATITAPQGGTTSAAHDGNPETVMTTVNNLGVTNPFVVLHVDLGAPVAVIAVDVLNFNVSAGALTGEFRIQYSTDDAAWSNFADAMDVDASARSRRKRVKSPVTARYWRFVRIGATSLASTVSIGEIKIFQDTGQLSDGRLMPFAYETAEAYMTVLSEKNLDVFNGFERTASVGIPHLSSHMPITNYAQSLDTLLAFHPDVETWRIFRQGSDSEFDFRAQAFENIPQHDFGAGTGGTDEVQTIWFDADVVATDSFTILLEGERTAAIRGEVSQANVAAAIEAALRALSNTSSSGITVAEVTEGFAVTFAGEDGKRSWAEMSISVIDGDRVSDVSRTTKGKYPGEDIFSASRGYARCGCFYGDRLHIGGFKGLPNAMVSSIVSEFFNLDIERDDDTKALLTRSIADQVGAIYQIVAGRHLSVFTNDGEFYIPQEPISDQSVMKLTTRSGSKEGIRPYEVDGALIFVQGVKSDDETQTREIGTSIREFLFVDTVQSYEAANLSKLSGHIIKNPVDSALRKSVSTKEADIILLPNEDGTMTAYTTLRNDSVNAFIPQFTRVGDKILQVGVDKKRRVYFIVERKINGQTRRFIEMWNENLFLDGGGIEKMVYETFIATEGQTDFVWTFGNPAEAAAVGVRIDGGRLQHAVDYSADLGTKTVSLAEGVPAGTLVRVSKMVKEISGLDYLEGETVQTFIDGTAGEDVVVTGGVLDIVNYADTEIQYGFDFPTYGKMMPFRVPESTTLAGEKIRVVRAILSLFETGGIEIRANGGRWRPVPLLQLDSDILDRSTMETLFTGEKIISSLPGFAVGGYLEFRQTSPGPLTVRAITREVAV